MPVNVELLKKVRKLIKQQPKRLDMHLWGVKYPKSLVRKKSSGLPPCGTVACLAGWTVFAGRPELMDALTPRETLLSTLLKQDTTVASEAARLLGIAKGDCPFDRTGWGVPEVLAWIDRQIDAASK